MLWTVPQCGHFFTSLQVPTFNSEPPKTFVFVAGCAVVRPWESIIIGATGGVVSILGTLLFDHMQIDDPVGAISVHGLAGIWVRTDCRWKNE